MFDIDDLFGGNNNTKSRDSRRKLSRSEENEVVDRQNNKCAICGNTLKRAHTHFDHKNPYAKGGSTSIRNIQALCANCHCEKTNKDNVKEIKKKRASASIRSNSSYGMPDFEMPDYELPDFELPNFKPPF